MKGCIVAGLVLALVLGCVTVNSVFVRNTVAELLEAIRTLPRTPEPDTATQAVSSLLRLWETHLPLLEITVPGTSLNRITETLLLLQNYAQRGDEDRYALALVILEELVEELLRAEEAAPENVLEIPKAPTALARGSLSV